MSKFIAILICGALIFTLFLTVFAIGDQYGADPDKEDPKLTTSSTSALNPVPEVPNHGLDAELYTEKHTGGTITGYSVVNGVAFFFKGFDYSVVGRDYQCVKINVSSCKIDGVDYSPNVRYSYDGAVWDIPTSYSDSEYEAFTNDSINNMILVSYLHFEVNSLAEAEAFYMKLWQSGFYESEGYFDVRLSSNLGDLPDSIPGEN